MFTKNKMNFFSGKGEKSASKTGSSSSTPPSNAEPVRHKQSTEFQQFLTQQQANEHLVNSSSNLSQRGSAHISSLSNPLSLASGKSLPPESENNKNSSSAAAAAAAAVASHRQERAIPSQAPPPGGQTGTALHANVVVPAKPKLLRSSVNNNQVSKISERFSRSMEDNKELQQKLEAKRQEAERITKEYYEHLKTIRAVDDDYSTIKEKLNLLHAKINQYLLNVKGHIKDPATATQVFQSIEGWDRIQPAIQHLVNKKEGGLLLAITQLAEKYIIEQISKAVYNAPIYIGMPQNGAFVEVSQYMEGYSNWAARLRQQLCTITVKAIKNPSEKNEIYKATETAKAQLVARILTTLSEVYSPSVHQELATRLKSYVEEAAAISLAMHSSPDVVRPMRFIEGKDKVDPEMIELRYGKTAENSTIQIVVCPPFIYTEDNILNILTKGKVITF